jgi:hypothetical protein
MRKAKNEKEKEKEKRGGRKRKIQIGTACHDHYIDIAQSPSFCKLIILAIKLA